MTLVYSEAVVEPHDDLIGGPHVSTAELRRDVPAELKVWKKEGKKNTPEKNFFFLLLLLTLNCRGAAVGPCWWVRCFLRVHSVARTNSLGSSEASSLIRLGGFENISLLKCFNFFL